jgi:uncharacterized DUF497 family protein
VRFEFDPSKNAENLAKHHVSFEEAAQIWDDPDLLVLHARRRGEKRMLAIGRTYAAVFSVIHTRRGDAIRIISARLATSEERRTYERHSGDQ